MTLIFLHEDRFILIEILLEFANKDQINNKLGVAQVMADQGPLLLTWFNFNPSMDK